MAAKKATSTAKTSKVKTTKKTATVSTADPVTTTTRTKVVAKKITPKKDFKKDFFATNSPLMSASIAEFIGTFILASIFILTRGEHLYLGFSVMALVMFIGILSGAHLNPLVTVGAWATKKIRGMRAVAYVIAQILGAMVAFSVISAFVAAAPTPDPATVAQGGAAAATVFSVLDISTLSDKHMYIFFAELLGAAIFGMAFASVLREKTSRVTSGLTIGFGYMLALLISGVAISYLGQGASVILNPAVALTLGAIDWANIQTQLWPFLVYIVSPILGGVIGFFVYDTLRAEGEMVSKEI